MSTPRFMRWAPVAWLLSLLVAAPAGAQTYADKLVVGASDSPTTAAVLRVVGLGTRTTGQDLLGIDSNGDITKGLLAKGDLPAVTAYIDEAETWASLQTFSTGVALANGTAGAPSLRFTNGTTTGLYRISSTSLGITAGGTLRVTVADTGTTVANALTASSTFDATGAATFASTLGVTGLATLTGGFSAGASSGVTGALTATTLAATGAATVGTTLGVGGLSTLTGGYAAGADSSITGNLALTGDVAVNGGDLTSTASPLNINPGGRIHMVDNTTFADNAGTNNYASQTTGWRVTAAGAADFRYLFTDEMHAKAFVADLEMALNGGQIIAKSSALVSQAFTCPAAAGTATLWVRDLPSAANVRAFAASDWVVLRTFSRTDADADGNLDLTIGDCVGQVSAYADGASGNEGTQSWTFTRGSGGNAGAMAASTVVPVDAVAVDFGVSGQGFLLASANDGAEGANAPYWQAVTWTTAPVAANMKLQTRWGQLNGAYGYGASTYGFCAGDASSVFLCAEPTNGLRILQGGSNQKVRVDPSGYVLLGQTGTGEANAYFDNTKATLRRGLVEGVTLTSAGIELFDGTGVRRIFMDGPSGNLMLGRDGTGEENLLITPTYATFRVAGVNTLYMDGTNGIAVGEVASGKNNVLIDTAGNLSLRTHTAAKISMAASTGNISMDGSLTVGTAGHLKGGATAYGTGAGFWLGYDTGAYKFYVGNGTSSSSKYLSWTGSDLTVAGTVRVFGGMSLESNDGSGYSIKTSSLGDIKIINTTALGTISLQASGGLNVSNGTSSGNGFTGTKTVRASGGAADCTLIYVLGVLTGGSC